MTDLLSSGFPNSVQCECAAREDAALPLLFSFALSLFPCAFCPLPRYLSVVRSGFECACVIDGTFESMPVAMPPRHLSFVFLLHFELVTGDSEEKIC